MDALKQWENLIAIWTAVIVLLHWQDLAFGLLVPFAFWQLSLINYFTLHKRLVFLIVVFCTLVITGQSVCPIDPDVYMEHNPLLYVVRQKILNYQLKTKAFNLSSEHTIDPALFTLTNQSLYKRTGNPEFPLEETPITQKNSLPFAVKTKPNVVVIILESIRAFELGAYGSQPSFTPNIDAIQKEGIIFKNFYANGAQTIRGEFAIHSSYIPNMSGASVYIDKPDLSVVTLSMILKKHGYQTLWIGSHPPTFDKKIRFLSRHGIDEFKYKVPTAKKRLGWGPPDEDMFEYAFNILSSKKQPFFAEIMTLSNHFPFNENDSPTKAQCPAVSGSATYRSYTQGVYYTDYAIGTFFKKLRQSKLLDNTIFIITGDHGIWLYPDSEKTKDMVTRQEIYFRSPCIIWSPKLLEPQTIKSIGSHVDLAPTILDLLDIHEKNYFMGTSLFRDDVENRYVLTIQDNRWNLRLGNDYTYDTGPEAFTSHFPNSIFNCSMFNRGRDANHRSFSTESDILDLAHTSSPLSDARSKELSRFAREGLDFFQGLIFSNRIAPPADGLMPISENITPEERDYMQNQEELLGGSHKKGAENDEHPK